MLLGSCDLQAYLTFHDVQNTLCTCRSAAVTFDFFVRRLLVRIIEHGVPQVTLRRILQRFIRRAETFHQERTQTSRVRSSKAARILEVLLATADLQGHLNLTEVRHTLSTCRRTALALLLLLRWLIPRLIWRAIIRRRVEFAAAIRDVSNADTVSYVGNLSTASSEVSHDHTPTFRSSSEDSVTLEFLP
ncbi:MAG: hypothetical protein GY768_21345 [Planctomycetaceae bacterium]|nr:hypothetical protein [Planctomycetaceae bacterium]